MFLTTEDLSIDGFLKAISFIPPKGMTVDYFISPNPIDIEGSEDYFEIEQDPSLRSDSITYNRKDPNTKIYQADTPAEYAENFSKKLVNTGNKMPVMPQSTPIESIGCPFVDVVSDTNLGTDVLLKEDYGPFPKNTLFHCVTEDNDE